LLRFGNRSHVAAVPAGDTAPPSGDPRVLEGEVRFRVQAAAARSVAVAGDFNGWSETATPLERVADGWWELRLRLPAGSYQFVYVVDGEWRTPDRAETLVDDGFGGANGLFRVPPDGV
jgi:1,4-alpha-glucan branching enzyme